MIKFTLAPK